MPKNILPRPPSIECSPKEHKNWILTRLKLIMSAYRKDDFQDAEGYVVQAAMVLERYSNAVIIEATDPVRGIQSHVKFPPSLAELREYCDELNRRSGYAKQWDEQSRKQLTERIQIEQEAQTLEERVRIVQRVKNEMQAKGFQFSK